MPTTDIQGYMTPEHSQAFLDIEVVDRPLTKVKTEWVLCHVCKGHGGWNLLLDQHKKQPPGARHFQCWCSQCWGSGWVEAGSLDDLCPRHEWSEVKVGRCLHDWTCKHCGVVRAEVDSSD